MKCLNSNLEMRIASKAMLSSMMRFDARQMGYDFAEGKTESSFATVQNPQVHPRRHPPSALPPSPTTTRSTRENPIIYRLGRNDGGGGVVGELQWCNFGWVAVKYPSDSNYLGRCVAERGWGVFFAQNAPSSSGIAFCQPGFSVPTFAPFVVISKQ